MSVPTLQAPAKLNLTLEVLAKRQDGFHEIRSVIQTISLCDSLRFQLSQNIEFNCDQPDWIPEKSLVSKAVGLLQEVTGCNKGAAIEVNKRIPLLSGLGGDSSDAAAILRGLNELWGLGLSLEELLELASQLGSDVAFFLYGGTALVEGRGEVVIPLPSVSAMWVVLLLPPVPRMPRKTERLYAMLKASHYTGGQITDRLVVWLTGGGEVISSMLFNVFGGVALDNFARLKRYWEQFVNAGAESVHLAGSGPTLFTLMKDRAQAEEVYRRLQEQGLESYLVETIRGV
jgi:4-diphosphocytidyl-2-C-methyl-D-erythritol kinase